MYVHKGSTDLKSVDMSKKVKSVDMSTCRQISNLSICRCKKKNRRKIDRSTDRQITDLIFRDTLFRSNYYYLSHLQKCFIFRCTHSPVQVLSRIVSIFWTGKYVPMYYCPEQVLSCMSQYFMCVGSTFRLELILLLQSMQNLMPHFAFRSLFLILLLLGYPRRADELGKWCRCLP